jgi:PRC-barrel domain
MSGTIDVERLSELVGVTVFDSADEPIGTVHEVFYDVVTIRPLWVGVAAGRPGDSSRVVLPLEAARIDDAGLRLPYTTEHMHGAPPAAGDMGRAQEHKLRAYYGLVRPELEGRPSSSHGARLRKWPQAGPSRSTTDRGSPEPQKRRL